MLRIITLFLFSSCLYAQTVQPLIVEYKQTADGMFTVTNNTLKPMAVVLEPRSFRVLPDGTAQFRPLDSAIHLELSTMSIRLAPKQSYTIFYKAHADKTPAWFTIYASFSALTHGSGLALKIMLPHTVYLYQKDRMAKSAIVIEQLHYEPATKRIICNLQNDSPDLGRVLEIVADSKHESETVGGGFPLLPGGERHLDVAWKGKHPPESLQFHFEHFTLKQPVNQQNQPLQTP